MNDTLDVSKLIDEINQISNDLDCSLLRGEDIDINAFTEKTDMLISYLKVTPEDERAQYRDKVALCTNNVDKWMSKLRKQQGETKESISKLDQSLIANRAYTDTQNG